MLRSLVQNSVPGDTGIFVMTSYLKVGFYDGTLRNPNFVPAKRLDAHLFASAPYVIRGGHAHTPWTPSREALDSLEGDSWRALSSLFRAHSLQLLPASHPVRGACVGFSLLYQALTQQRELLL
jgi:hypothetical protein